MSTIPLHEKTALPKPPQVEQISLGLRKERSEISAYFVFKQTLKSLGLTRCARNVAQERIAR
jgi:hypothetical protein